MDFKTVLSTLIEKFSKHNIYNPVEVDVHPDMDRLLEFLPQFNEFINHEPREFKKIIDRNMRL